MAIGTFIATPERIEEAVEQEVNSVVQMGMTTAAEPIIDSAAMIDRIKSILGTTENCMTARGAAQPERPAQVQQSAQQPARTRYVITAKDYGQGPGLTALPVSTHNGTHIADRRHPYSVGEALTKFYGEDLSLVLGNYVQMEQDTIRKAGVLRNSQTIRLLSYYFRFTESRIRQPVDETVVDFIVTGRLEGDNGQRENEDFRIRYILDMRPCERRCIGPVINMCKEDDPILPRYRIRTDKYLLPIIRSQDYERIAHEIIDTYFPEARDTDDFVPDAEELARRMGLKVRDVRFSDPDIMGQIYYAKAATVLLDDAGNPYTETIRPGEVLISKDNCKTEAARRGTIVHECCHMYLDRWYFLLQIMTGQPYVAYTCRKKRSAAKRQVNGNAYYPQVTQLGWMELHCDKMPAYILLESERTKKYVDGILGGRRSPEAVRRAVNGVAEHYHVSRTMAKCRLVELGINEAEGVNVYVDDRAIPDHGCTGSWRQGITYTISAYDMAVLCSEERQLEEELRSGRYRYIEGHFYLNDKRFISSDRYGNEYLTAYARHHIDECCMAFRPRGRYAETTFHNGRVARRKTEQVTDRYCGKYKLDAVPDEKAYMLENAAFSDDSLLWGELLYDMSDDCRKAFTDIMKRKGVTQEALALSLGVDRKVVYNFLNTEQPSLEHIVGVCVALKLPYYISMKLIDRAGASFRRKEIHHLYRQFLLQSGVLTVERCNDILKARNYPPLFRGDG